MRRSVTMAAPVYPVLISNSDVPAFPDTTNTGVLGAPLTTITMSGTLWRVSTDGSGPVHTTEVIDGNTYWVFSNYHFVATSQYVYVDNPYVRFDHCQFDISGEVNNTSAMVQTTGVSALLFDDCSFNGGLTYDNRAIQSNQGHLTVNRCQFLNYADAACQKNGDATTDMIVNDSYFSQAKGWAAAAHADAIQTDGPIRDVVIHHNTIWEEPYRATDGDTSAGQVSDSCIAMQLDLGNARNITIDNNQMAGGGYCMYIIQQSPFLITGTVSVHDNRFDRTKYSSLGGHACIWTPNGVMYPGGGSNTIPASTSANWANNVWENGSALSYATATT